MIDYQRVMLAPDGIYTEEFCPMIEAMKVIGGKWKLTLIARIHRQSPARFGELKRSLVGITQKMLTTQLRELEQEASFIEKSMPKCRPK